LAASAIAVASASTLSNSHERCHVVSICDLRNKTKQYEKKNIDKKSDDEKGRYGDEKDKD